MVKCLDCENVSEYDEQATCPVCDSEALYYDAMECKDCGQYFSDEDVIYEGWCYACAVKSITIEDGMDYIRKNDLEKDFYVEWFFNSECGQASEELIRVCKTIFVSEPNLTSIKDFIIGDIDHWIDYLNKR